MAMSRRRFLSIASASCATSLAPGLAHAGGGELYRWRGVALGAQAQILLDHPEAAQISRMAQAEIARLERVFSLFQSDSEVMRLNRTGRLDAPSFELLDCLAIARRVHEVTEGRFDPTVQPLWQVVARAASEGKMPAQEDLKTARNLIGFERLSFDSAAITLAPGQALTLNGIAQGYIADRVASLLRSHGITDVLIDTGEISARGAAPDREAWPVTIAGEGRARQLHDRALATSALLGTVLAASDPASNAASYAVQGHILDPRDGAFHPRGARQVSVSATTAALADGLSTGLSLVARADQARALLSNIKDARLESFIT